MSENKPREFWVDPEEHSYVTEKDFDGNDREWPCGNCFNYEYADTIRVIEYSAYQKCINMLKAECYCTGETNYSNPPKPVLCDICELLQELGEDRGDG